MIRHILALLLASPATAATLPVIATPPIAATCETLAKVVSAAPPGSTVKLSGTCAGRIAIYASKVPAVTVDATGATLAQVYLANAAGLHWVGGTFGPNPAYVAGFQCLTSRDVSITGARLTGLAFGVSFDRCDQGAIVGNRIDFVAVDAIRFFNGVGGTITGNSILGAAPVDPAAHHPDAIQLASDIRVTSDVTITGNTIVGDGQGITGFVGGKLKGGYDRVTVTGNVVRTSYPLGVAIYNCRACTISGNDVRPIALAPKAVQISLPNFTGIACGNVTQRMDAAKEPMTLACPQ